MQSESGNPPSAVPGARGPVSVRKLPVSLFGAVMGLSGLALAWRLAHNSLGAPAFVGEAIGAFAIGVFVLISLAYLAKFIQHPDAVRAEFSHPAASAFFGTIVISILMLAAILEPYGASAAQAIWSFGIVATFTLSFVLVSRLMRGEVDVLHAGPAWLLAGVATLNIPATGAHMDMPWAAEVKLMACSVGAVLALVLFVMIISRLVHREPLAPVLTPSLMILVAPFAVGFLAYTQIVGGIDRFAALLFYFGVFMFVLVAPKVFRPGVPFSPAWWAIGFPMAALTNAALKYAEFKASTPLWILAIVLLGVLSLALAVLTVRTAVLAVNGKLLR